MYISACSTCASQSNAERLIPTHAGCWMEDGGKMETTHQLAGYNVNHPILCLRLGLSDQLEQMVPAMSEHGMFEKQGAVTISGLDIADCYQ